MSTFKSLYLKAHNAQTQLLIDAGIQVDIEGYPLCSDSTLEKTLNEKQLEDYDHYESKKDLLNRKWKRCHYHPDSCLSDPIRKIINEEINKIETEEEDLEFLDSLCEDGLMP